MKVEILTYCDFAAIYGLSLCITGATDFIFGKEFPLIVPSSCVIWKVRLEADDEGEHFVQARICDLDLKVIFESQISKMPVQFKKEPELESKFRIRRYLLHNLKIPKPGEYNVELLFDNKQLAFRSIFAGFPNVKP
jgi:hypothetical protein